MGNSDMQGGAFAALGTLGDDTGESDAGPEYFDWQPYDLAWAIRPGAYASTVVGQLAAALAAWAAAPAQADLAANAAASAAISVVEAEATRVQNPPASRLAHVVAV